jgi:hypothetical protein
VLDSDLDADFDFDLDTVLDFEFDTVLILTLTQFLKSFSASR